MTYDNVDILQRFAAKEKIGFALLSDPGSAIIGAFGLIDESAPRDSGWYGFAHPIIFVIGPDGVVRHRFSESFYRNRPDVDLVYDILRKESGG